MSDLNDRGVSKASQGQFLKTVLQNNKMNVLSSLGNFTIGKLETGTYHMFSKKKTETKHISPPMKASSFIAAWLCCTKPAWE